MVRNHASVTRRDSPIASTIRPAPISDGMNCPAEAATSAKSASNHGKGGRSSSTPIPSNIAPHNATDPVDVTTAKLRSLNTELVGVRPAGLTPTGAPRRRKSAPPRSRISLPENKVPAMNSGIM